MLLRELFNDAEEELTCEIQGLAKEQIKERLKEIRMAKLALKKMEKQLQELLSREIDDIEL